MKPFFEFENSKYNKTGFKGKGQKIVSPPSLPSTPASLPPDIDH